MPDSVTEELESPPKISKGRGAALLPTTKGTVLQAAYVGIIKFDLTKENLLKVKRWAQHYEALERALRSATTITRRRRVSFYMEHSFAARVCAVLVSRRRKEKPISFSMLLKLATEVRTRQGSGEAVLAFERAKPEGGLRHLASFGRRDRAAKRIVDDILRIVWGLSPYEYARKGRGREVATRAYVDRFNKGGSSRLVAFDLSNGYGSINRDWVMDNLPLAKSAIRHSVLIHQTKLLHGTVSSVEAVQTGLTQGSRPSATVLSHVMQEILDAVGPAGLKGSYGDDGFVATSTEQAEPMKNALALAIAEHPAGPLKLKLLTVNAPGDPGNNLLGYMIRHGGRGIRSTPSHKAILRFQRRVARALVGADDATSVIFSMADNWANSFQCWSTRRTGADAAIGAALNEVLPIVRGFERLLAVKGLASLPREDMVDLFDQTYLADVGKLSGPMPLLLLIKTGTNGAHSMHALN